MASEDSKPEVIEDQDTITSADTPSRTLRLYLSESQLRLFALLGVLIGLWTIFQWLTGGTFLTPRNISGLSVQVSITAIMACGIVMLMIPAQIDLSIGSSIALTAIVAASVITGGRSLLVGFVAALVCGLVIGIWHGFWVAVLKIPAFIVTLASFLILRGIALWMTQGTTRAPDKDISFLANSFVPASWSVVLFSAVFLGSVGLLRHGRNIRRAAETPAPLMGTVVLPSSIVGVACLAGSIVAILYRGLPLPVAILMVVALGIGLTLHHTRFGRYLHAIGANREATRRVGIRVERNLFGAFLVMGFLYGLGGLLLLSRLSAAPPNAATGLELNVIAAAVIGGTSLFGGIGSVGGAVLGALIMETLRNGMILLNIPSYWQQIIVGLILLVAVYIDHRTQQSRRSL